MIDTEPLALVSTAAVVVALAAAVVVVAAAAVVVLALVAAAVVVAAAAAVVAAGVEVASPQALKMAANINTKRIILNRFIAFSLTPD
jgi:hypothetical protein